jgi:hypothetical protein
VKMTGTVVITYHFLLFVEVTYGTTRKHENVTVTRERPIETVRDVEMVKKALENHFPGADRIYLINPPHMLGATYTKDGKPYEPPLEVEDQVKS